jgi:(2Fe-2S) ferredoxin
MKISSMSALEKLKKQGMASLFPKKTKIMVGMATCGQATGAGQVFEAISAGVKKKRLDVIVKKTGCIGFCHEEPLVDVLMPGSPRLTYTRMTPQKASKVLDAVARKTIRKGAMGRMDEDEFLLDDARKGYVTGVLTREAAAAPLYEDLPFYQKQMKVALRNCGLIDPEDIREYVAKGGYFTLARALRNGSPQEVIREVERSDLRGRGGAGFSTGMKWKICRRARGDEKYVICNADEGDPGAYMDRSIIEGDPHSVIEGMAIAAYAVGAHKGYAYVRAEYPLALERLTKALDQARKHGLLGCDILKSGFDFDITISQGSGASRTRDLRSLR